MMLLLCILCTCPAWTRALLFTRSSWTTRASLTGLHSHPSDSDLDPLSQNDNRARISSIFKRIVRDASYSAKYRRPSSAVRDLETDAPKVDISSVSGQIVNLSSMCSDQELAYIFKGLGELNVRAVDFGHTGAWQAIEARLGSVDYAQLISPRPAQAHTPRDPPRHSLQYKAVFDLLNGIERMEIKWKSLDRRTCLALDAVVRNQLINSVHSRIQIFRIVVILGNLQVDLKDLSEDTSDELRRAVMHLLRVLPSSLCVSSVLHALGKMGFSPRDQLSSLQLKRFKGHIVHLLPRVAPENAWKVFSGLAFTGFSWRRMDVNIRVQLEALLLRMLPLVDKAEYGTGDGERERWNIEARPGPRGQPPPTRSQQFSARGVSLLVKSLGDLGLDWGAVEGRTRETIKRLVVGMLPRMASRDVPAMLAGLAAIGWRGDLDAREGGIFGEHAARAVLEVNSWDLVQILDSLSKIGQTYEEIAGYDAWRRVQEKRIFVGPKLMSLFTASLGRSIDNSYKRAGGRYVIPVDPALRTFLFTYCVRWTRKMLVADVFAMIHGLLSLPAAQEDEPLTVLSMLAMQQRLLQYRCEPAPLGNYFVPRNREGEVISAELAAAQRAYPLQPYSTTSSSASAFLTLQMDSQPDQTGETGAGAGTAGAGAGAEASEGSFRPYMTYLEENANVTQLFSALVRMPLQEALAQVRVLGPFWCNLKQLMFQQEIVKGVEMALTYKLAQLEQERGEERDSVSLEAVLGAFVALDVPFSAFSPVTQDIIVGCIHRADHMHAPPPPGPPGPPGAPGDQKSRALRMLHFLGAMRVDASNERFASLYALALRAVQVLAPQVALDEFGVVVGAVGLIGWQWDSQDPPDSLHDSLPMSTYLTMAGARLAQQDPQPTPAEGLLQGVDQGVDPHRANVLSAVLGGLARTGCQLRLLTPATQACLFAQFHRYLLEEWGGSSHTFAHLLEAFGNMDAITHFPDSLARDCIAFTRSQADILEEADVIRALPWLPQLHRLTLEPEALLALHNALLLKVLEGPGPTIAAFVLLLTSTCELKQALGREESVLELPVADLVIGYFNRQAHLLSPTEFLAVVDCFHRLKSASSASLDDRLGSPLAAQLDAVLAQYAAEVFPFLPQAGRAQLRRKLGGLLADSALGRLDEGGGGSPGAIREDLVESVPFVGGGQGSVKKTLLDMRQSFGTIKAENAPNTLWLCCQLGCTYSDLKLCGLWPLFEATMVHIPVWEENHVKLGMLLNSLCKLKLSADLLLPQTRAIIVQSVTRQLPRMSPRSASNALFFLAKLSFGFVAPGPRGGGGSGGNPKSFGYSNGSDASLDAQFTTLLGVCEKSFFARAARMTGQGEFSNALWGLLRLGGLRKFPVSGGAPGPSIFFSAKSAYRSIGGSPSDLSDAQRVSEVYRAILSVQDSLNIRDISAILGALKQINVTWGVLSQPLQSALLQKQQELVHSCSVKEFALTIFNMGGVGVPWAELPTVLRVGIRSRFIEQLPRMTSREAYWLVSGVGAMGFGWADCTPEGRKLLLQAVERLLFVPTRSQLRPLDSDEEYSPPPPSTPAPPPGHPQAEDNPNHERLTEHGLLSILRSLAAFDIRWSLLAYPTNARIERAVRAMVKTMDTQQTTKLVTSMARLGVTWAEMQKSTQDALLKRLSGIASFGGRRAKPPTPAADQTHLQIMRLLKEMQFGVRDWGAAKSECTKGLLSDVLARHSRAYGSKGEAQGGQGQGQGQGQGAEGAESEVADWLVQLKYRWSFMPPSAQAFVLGNLESLLRRRDYSAAGRLLAGLRRLGLNWGDLGPALHLSLRELTGTDLDRDPSTALQLAALKLAHIAEARARAIMPRARWQADSMLAFASTPPPASVLSEAPAKADPRSSLQRLASSLPSLSDSDFLRVVYLLGQRKFPKSLLSEGVLPVLDRRLQGILADLSPASLSAVLCSLVRLQLSHAQVPLSSPLILTHVAQSAASLDRRSFYTTLRALTELGLGWGDLTGSQRMGVAAVIARTATANTNMLSYLFTILLNFGVTCPDLHQYVPIVLRYSLLRFFKDFTADGDSHQQEMNALLDTRVGPTALSLGGGAEVQGAKVAPPPEITSQTLLDTVCRLGEMGATRRLVGERVAVALLEAFHCERITESERRKHQHIVDLLMEGGGEAVGGGAREAAEAEAEAEGVERVEGVA